MSTGTLVAVLALLVTLTACGPSVQLVKPPVRDAELYPRSQTRAAVSVAADEISNPDRVRRYFGVDLTADEILPVNIVISNHSDDRVLVKPSEILLLEGERIIDAMPRELVEAAAGRRLSRSAVAELALEETVVPPQQTYQGVLFYKMPRQGTGLYSKVERFLTNTRYNIRIALTDLDSGNRITYGPFPITGL